MPKNNKLYFVAFCLLIVFSNINQVYSQDTTPPVFVTPPQNKTISCEDANPIGTFTTWYNSVGGAVIMDNSGTYIVQGGPPFNTALNFLNASADTLCGNTKKVKVTWIAFDPSNNASPPYSATFSIVDTLGPVVLKQPRSPLLECTASVQDSLIEWIRSAGGARASDVCSPTVEWVSYNYQTSTGAFGTDSIATGSIPLIPNSRCDWSINVSFIVKDECGNTAVTEIATFRIKDTKPPIFSITPPDVSVACHQVPPPANVTANDVCSGVTPVTFSETSTRSTDPNSCSNYNYTLKRLWKSTDNCNNKVEYTQTISVTDGQAPIFNLPTSITLPCTNTQGIDSLSKFITDNCSKTTFSFIDSLLAPPSCNYSIKRKITATDVCGNTSMRTINVQIIDKTPPTITTPASNQGLDCGLSGDFNTAFANWLSSFGGSGAQDNCNNGIKRFAAKPGTYNLRDTTTFPGTHPGTLDQGGCGNTPGFSRSEKVDFVYYDACGNATVTTAFFGIIDTISPTIGNCTPIITRDISSGCSIDLDLAVPFSSDNCSASTSPIVRIASTLIRSNDPGNLEIPVNDITLEFGPFNQNTFSIIDNPTLDVELINTDADDFTEFFKVFDENGLEIGRTQNTPTQCGSINTTIQLNKTQLETWLSDGRTRFFFRSNRSDTTILAINDVCTGSRLNATLTIPIFSDNLIKVFYTRQEDTTLIGNATSIITQNFEAGSHDVSFLFRDCAGNTTSCKTKINIRDVALPSISCLKDTVIQVDAANCIQEIKLPLAYDANDNCSFQSIFNATLPATTDLQMINFEYNAASNVSLALNKFVSFVNVPKIKYSNGSALLHVKLTGDINDATEYYTLIGEGGFQIGNTKNASTSCGTSSSSFEIPANIFNNWIVDGKIDITALANNNATEEGRGINPCSPLTTQQSTDGKSKITINLSVAQPSFEYSIDNASPTLIAHDSSFLKLKLQAGVHQLKFTTSDKAGNKVSCQSNLELKDIVKPIAKCKDITINIHPSGQIPYQVVADSIDNQSTDNCEIDSMWVENDTYACQDIGMVKNAILHIKDSYGNTAQCTSKVRVFETLLIPSYTTGLCGGDTLKLFANMPPPFFNALYQFTWSKDNISLSSLENPTLTGPFSVLNGIYKVTAMGNNGCKSEGTILVNINPISTPVISGLQDSYCQGETVTIKTTQFSGEVRYLWYEGFPPNGTLLDSTSTAEYLVKNPSLGPHNYYVIAKSISCISQASLTKRTIIYNKPNPVLNSTFLTICEGGDIALGTSTTGNNLEYKWSGPNNFTANTAMPAVIKNATTSNQGKYKLVISQGQCGSDTAITSVAIIPKPKLPIINGQTIYCEGNAVILKVENLSNQEKYIWIKDGIRFRVTQINSLELLNVTASAGGKWQVVVESNGCNSDTSDIKEIDIQNAIIVGASNSGPVCQGDSLELVATFLPNTNYTWIAPDAKEVSGRIIKVKAQKGVYKVFANTTTGCATTAETTVVINETPVIASITSDAKPCMDANAEIKLSSSLLNGNGSITYNWKGPNNFLSNLQNPNIAPVTSLASGAYFLQVFNDKCPSDIQVLNIAFDIIPPKANLIAPTSICQGDTLVLTTTSTAQNYVWNTPIGVFTSDKQTYIIPDVKLNAEGNYHLLLKQGLCTSSAFDVIQIDVREKPNAPAIIGDNLLCYGDSLLLSPNNIAYQQALWLLPNGSELNSKTIKIGNADKSLNGEYKVKLVVNGCTSDYSQAYTIKVKDQIPTPTLVLDKIPLCTNENIVVKMCTTNASPNTTYQWKDASTNKIIKETQSDCIEVASNTIPIGTSFINLYALVDGCSTLTPAVLQIEKQSPPAIAAAANIDIKAVCSTDENIELIANQNTTVTDIAWQSLTSGVKILSPNENKTLVTDFAEGQNIILLSYSKDGCKNFSTDTVYLILSSKPAAVDDNFNLDFNADFNFNIIENDEIGPLFDVTLQVPDGARVQGSKGVYEYLARKGFAGEIKIPYRVCIKGCQELCDEAVATLIVGANIDCQVPTIITPNEDGINDEMIIPCISTGRYNNNELFIFNQWGDEVYRAQPYDNNWKGTYGSDNLPAGTYYFVFKPSPNDKSINGYLIIQR